MTPDKMLGSFQVPFLILAWMMQSFGISSTQMRLPKDLLIGVATSAYQIEGAWNISDKSESNWDRFVHEHPKKIADSSTGDVACDSYHKYTDDMELLDDLQVDHYRFSISWTRILPQGSPKYVSRDGVRHYHKILDELEKRKIIPFVTMYHWDHPQVLEEFGGWLNEKMAHRFADYARVIFQEFGRRVKFFSTLNEPNVFCRGAYRTAKYAPGLKLTGVGEYSCIHNMLKAHAMTYHMYNREFRDKQKGQIGLVNACWKYYSKFRNDSISSDVAFEFDCGWVANAIFSEKGDYPEVMKERIAMRSRSQGYHKSRLPKFSDQWVSYIKNSADYFGLNHYTSEVVETIKSAPSSWPNDEGLIYSSDPRWPTSQSKWLKVNPKGIRDVLRTIKEKYNNPPVYILENGVSHGNGTHDNFRINYLSSYLKETLLARERDNCSVKAYTVWTLLDDFEWEVGYTAQFGLVDVDFGDKKRKRTLKKSATWLKNLLKSRQLLWHNSV
ncbi:hypothetical protein QAD02_017345 [Eretmocerus hayati]|uniref:Uncharacterized protein n=1 Tax=Eretmocerus hayati TaxID=131215 RepID=A0ACC2PEQ5_9HYME|nr:hypothetical protein QAD02_017345 [Eretmocerus hayati]